MIDYNKDTAKELNGRMYKLVVDRLKIKNMRTLSFDLIEQVVAYYDKELEACAAANGGKCDLWVYKSLGHPSLVAGSDDADQLATCHTLSLPEYIEAVETFETPLAQRFDITFSYIDQSGQYGIDTVRFNFEDVVYPCDLMNRCKASAEFWCYSHHRQFIQVITQSPCALG